MTDSKHRQELYPIVEWLDTLAQNTKHELTRDKAIRFSRILRNHMNDLDKALELVAREAISAVSSEAEL